MTFLGNIAVCYAHAGSYQTSTNPTYYWQAYHVLGDGSIMPYRVQPTANTVSHASTIPAGATSFTVNAQAGSYVGISQNNVLKGAALVPASGSVNVPLSGIGSGQVHIVVTKPQRQPYIQDISVGGGGGTTYTIAVSANPTNGGTVTGGGTYQQGQSCTVSASANSGFTFTNWTENGSVVSTQASYTFTVNSNRTLVANFQAQTQSYTITVSANPSNGGTVTGGGSYQQGQTCTVHATPATGYTFVRWTENGNQVSTNANYSFTVTSNRNLVAQFQGQSFYIATNSNPSNGGTTSGSGLYTYGETCTVVATPATGYEFINWTENGGTVSTEASYSFTVTNGRNLMANFTVQTFQITTSVEPAEGGTATGGGTYHYGDEVTITIATNEDWAFQNWTENGNVVSEEKTFTFTATENHSFIANLEYTEGVGEQNGDKTLVYPNPVNDKLTVEAQDAIGTVEIYNLMGAMVYSQKNCTNKVEINTADLQSGIYFIRMTNDKVSETRRFVKE